jgi:hypothetical protein
MSPQGRSNGRTPTVVRSRALADANPQRPDDRREFDLFDLLGIDWATS